MNKKFKQGETSKESFVLLCKSLNFTNLIRLDNVIKGANSLESLKDALDIVILDKLVTP